MSGNKNHELELVFSLDENINDRLEVTKGYLSPSEQEVIRNEIRNDYARLAGSSSTEFRPRTIICGVPEGPVFNCVRSLGGDWRRPTLRISLTLPPAAESQIFDPPRLAHSCNQWSDEFLAALEDRFNNKSTDPPRTPENVALAFCINEIRTRLADPNVDGAILLFLGYLSFMKSDRERAGFYKLAAMAIEHSIPERPETQAGLFSREAVASSQNEKSEKPPNVFSRLFTSLGLFNIKWL